MSRHPLEDKWNTSAWDILSAIEHGFRAQVDVKGKLAEFYLHKHLEELRARGDVEGVEWQDIDGKPDFIVRVRGSVVRVECKNARSPKRPRATASPTVARVELQKTRNAKDGTPSRGYKTDEFDLLAVCLFNVTERWDYLFIATRSLARRSDDPDKPLSNVRLLGRDAARASQTGGRLAWRSRDSDGGYTVGGGEGVDESDRGHWQQEKGSIQEDDHAQGGHCLRATLRDRSR